MTRSMRALVGVLAVSVAACAHAPAATTATTAPATAATASVPGVNLREPRSGLFTGGQPAAIDWQAIRARGIGTVVNLRTDGELNERDEAAEVQAAGMRYISIPGIAPVIVLVASLSIGNVLNAGFDQIFNLYSPIVYSTGDIIDTYVYRIGLIQGQYSLGTAVGVFKTVVALLLIGVSYWAAGRWANYRIF